MMNLPRSARSLDSVEFETSMNTLDSRDLDAATQEVIVKPANSGCLSELACEEFLMRCGFAATHVVTAPGRVNLIGEHLDYNDGFVLPLAIDRFVTIAGASESQFSKLEFFSVDLQDSVSIPCGKVPQPVGQGWQNYILGVVAQFLERGIVLPPLKAVIASTVPLGSGLSSSAALEVAVATFLESITGHQLDPWDKVRMCQTAEHRFAGMPCGIMDQFSSVFGRAGCLMLLDCRNHDLRYIPFGESTTDDEAMTLLVANSNVKHALVDGEYALRRRQCESACEKLEVTSLRDLTVDRLLANADRLNEIEFRRAMHVVTEIARTLACADAIEQNNWKLAGQLMYESHDSLRDDYEVSCQELDLLVDLCRELAPDAGVFGSRMTGGGFGGSTVTLVRRQTAGRVIEAIGPAYKNKTGIQPTFFCCQPADGARQLKP